MKPPASGRTRYSQKRNKLPRSPPAGGTRYPDVTSGKFVSLPAGRQVCCLLSDGHRTFRQVEINIMIRSNTKNDK
ncbi:MAG: hypothetical protein ACPLY7_00255 [Microgenomates group bacterium]